MRARLRLIRTLCTCLAAGLAPIAVPAIAQPPAAAAVGSTPGGYMEYPDAEKARFVVNSRRLALLIGNDKYSQAPAYPEAPSRLPLSELNNSCEDARAVAMRLSSIGWKKAEIVLLCDLSGPQLELALGKFLERAPIDEEESKLMLVYLAGHGMQIEGRNYFMGTNAAPDYPRIAKTLVKTASSNQRRPILDHEAIDIYAFFTSRFGDQEVHFPMLVIADTCRNNPAVAKIVEAYAAERAQAPGEAHGGLNPFWATAGIRKTAGLPRGMSVVFATPSGNTIEADAGNGSSRLSGALQQEIRPQTDIDYVVQNVDSRLKRENQALPEARHQIIDQDGHLFIDSVHGHWCLSGCGRPGAAVRDAPEGEMHEVVALRPMLRWPAAFGDFWGSALASSAGTPPSLPLPATAAAPPAAREAPKRAASREVYRNKTPSELRPVTLDVFWCGDDDGENERYEQARRFTDAMSNRLSGSDGSFGQSQFQSVRLRRMSAQTNERPGYQRNDNSVYIDASDADERAAAQWIVATAGDMRIARVKRQTPGYLSAFFCKGAYARDVAPALYVQVPRAIRLQTASSVIDFLDGSQSEFAIQRTAAVRSVSPDLSEVRYFSETNRPQAEALARSLSDYLGAPVQAKNFCDANSGCDKPNKAVVEFWLGTSYESERDAISNNASYAPPEG